MKKYKVLGKLFFPNDENQSHLKYLDGLRGYAVLIVLLSHSSNYGFYVFNFLDFSGIGKSGVYLFFILSSYLLDRQIAQAFINNRLGTKYWINYALRRFLRIYPLYILVLFFNLILFKVTGNEYALTIHNLSELIDHLLLKKANGVFWSIPVEFIYYLISPFIMLLLFNLFKWKKHLVYGFLLLLIIGSYFFNMRYNFNQISTFRYLPFFLLGTLLAVFEIRNLDNYKKLRENYAQIVSFFGISALVFYMVLIPSVFFGIFLNQETYNYHYFSKSLYFPLFFIIWGIVLVTLKYGEDWFKFLFELRPIRFVGNISFSLYLLHLTPLSFLANYSVISKDSFFSSSINFLLFLIISVVISSLSYIIIEKPLSKIRLYSRNK